MTKQTEAMKLALEVMRNQGDVSVDEWIAAEKSLREALANEAIEQPSQPSKLAVTLEDRPIDIELAQYKRMFEAACSALGQIGDALGCDPEEGGAEPILAAIGALKAEQPAQHQCKFPMCHNEEYQQALAGQIERELVGEQPAQQEPVASEAYDMIDRFLRNNLSSDDDYAEYSAALDVIYNTPPAQPAPVQEPVGTLKIWFYKGHGNYDFEYWGSLGEGAYAVYTTPTAAPTTGETK